MTKDEYRAALEELGLTQRVASVYLRVSMSSSQGYALGTRPIPGPVAKLVEAAIAFKRNPRRSGADVLGIISVDRRERC